ncbi:uncharacterized protein LOC144429766 [Styela clava]
MVPSKHRWSGSYCCIPGCKSSSGNGDHLYHVPDGKNKKFGMPSKEWAQKFHQVVFKYCFSPNFKSKIEDAYSYAGARPNICSTCMRLHVHDQDSDKRKTNRFEKLKHVPLANRCTYATASKERLVALANINRQRLSDLENEVRKAGIMVSTNMSSMIEGLSEDEFLKDWWEVQQHLQKSNSKFGRRYPPSIIRRSCV